MVGRCFAIGFTFCLGVAALRGQAPPQTAARVFPTFENITAKAGIDFHLDAGNAAEWVILESNSAGVIVIDYDNDGWPDLYFVNGSTIARLNAHEKSRGNRLYRNNHDGTFSDVTTRAGVAGTGAWGMGGCVGDVDNNGFDDIFVTNYGPDILYLNNGDGTFRDASASAGIQGGARWHTGCAFGDYDGDGDLDLYVSSYVQFNPASPLPAAPPADSAFGTNGKRVLYGPKAYTPTPHEFYENIGGGRFIDVSKKSGVANGGNPAQPGAGIGGNGFGVVWGDYDNDGDLDVFVANDETPNFLFRNNGNKTFTEVGAHAGVALAANGNVLASMGVDMADFDNDGRLDIVVTNFANEPTEMFHNNGDGTFIEISRRIGVPPSLLMGWGTQLADFDLDGQLDLVVANGHVLPSLDESSQRLLLAGYRQRLAMFQHLPTGMFRELGTTLRGPFLESHVSRGLAVADLNNDGQMDIVVANQDDPPSVLLNRGVPGNWALVKLRGTTSNRSAIGARVTARAAGRTQIREVKSGGSYLSQSDLRVHFGLGDATSVDELTIRWPSGRVQTERNVKANQIVEITER